MSELIDALNQLQKEKHIEKVEQDGRAVLFFCKKL